MLGHLCLRPRVFQRNKCAMSGAGNVAKAEASTGSSRGNIAYSVRIGIRICVFMFARASTHTVHTALGGVIWSNVAIAFTKHQQQQHQQRHQQQQRRPQQQQQEQQQQQLMHPNFNKYALLV